MAASRLADNRVANALKKDLGKKLAVVYDSTAIADFVADGSNAAHVEALRIHNRFYRCVR